jgi:hypothetical protein
MEYHITTADHMLGSLIVKVIPVSSYCWSQVDTLCDPESKLFNFTTLHLEAFAPESAKDTHVWLCTTLLVSYHPLLLWMCNCIQGMHTVLPCTKIVVTIQNESISTIQ